MMSGSKKVVVVAAVVFSRISAASANSLVPNGVGGRFHNLGCFAYAHFLTNAIPPPPHAFINYK